MQRDKNILTAFEYHWLAGPIRHLQLCEGTKECLCVVYVHVVNECEYVFGYVDVGRVVGEFLFWYKRIFLQNR